jgi:multicomponent Na+:H+ antiporter subunit E
LKRSLSLFLLLFSFWLLLSGHLDLWLMGLGFFSSIGAVLLSQRMGTIDREGLPLVLLPGLVRYLPWLFGAVIRANADVARRILHPRLPIGPEVIRVPVAQCTALGRVSYANSITLTPGTLTLEVTAEEIEVHALSSEAANALRDGNMGRRVAIMESNRC